MKLLIRRLQPPPPNTIYIEGGTPGVAVVVAFVSEAYRGARIFWVFGVRFNKNSFFLEGAVGLGVKTWSAQDAGWRQDG